MNIIKIFANRKQVAKATGPRFYHDVASGKTITDRKEPAQDKAVPAKGPFTNYESQITDFYRDEGDEWDGDSFCSSSVFQVPGSRLNIPTLNLQTQPCQTGDFAISSSPVKSLVGA